MRVFLDCGGLTPLFGYVGDRKKTTVNSSVSSKRRQAAAVQRKVESLSHTWGTTSTERQLAFPCDGLLPNPDDSLFRSVTIAAAPATVFRWLCQLRVAPYSYDWIDNGGRQSPRELTAGVAQLEVGQDVMRIFELVSFAKDQHLTLRTKPRTRASRSFGEIVVSYLIVPGERDLCRLVVKLIARYPSGAKGRLMSALLPWGDLVMMRKQLLNFKMLAERRGGRQ